MTLSSARKALTPAVLGVIGVVIAWVATGDFDLVELRITGAALVTSVAVFAVPNIATSPFLKALVPAVLGVVAVGTSALESGAFNEGDLRIALAALLTSAVVFVVPNQARGAARSGGHYDHTHFAGGPGAPTGHSYHRTQRDF